MCVCVCLSDIGKLSLDQQVLCELLEVHVHHNTFNHFFIFFVRQELV